jgi:hypothetical protein
LKGSQKAGGSLDLLDLDACRLATVNVLDQLAGLPAEYIVASTEDQAEHKKRLDSVNLQNLEAVIETLLRNPKMSGRQYSHALIKLADAGANDGVIDSAGHKMTAVPTLSALHLARWQAFDQSLNDFGLALSDALASAPNRLSIEHIVQQLPSIPVNDSTEYRDLRNFAEKVHAAIESGTVHDPSGTLKDSVNRIIKSEAQLVVSYHGARNQPSVQGKDPHYESMGGLTVFLPSRRFLDVGKKSIDDHPLGELSKEIGPQSSYAHYNQMLAKGFAETIRDSEWRTAQYLAAAEDYWIDMGHVAKDAPMARVALKHEEKLHPQLKKLSFDAEHIEAAGSAEGYEKAYQELQSDVQSLLQSPLSKSVADGLESTLRADVDERFRHGKIQSTPGWTAFLEALRNGY